MYTTLFNRMEDVLAYIEREMMFPETHDLSHTQALHHKLQAALLEVEDIYVDADAGLETDCQLDSTS